MREEAWRLYGGRREKNRQDRRRWERKEEGDENERGRKRAMKMGEERRRE